jgi:tetratricopeptide (TPR) repeat protein
VKNHLKKYLPLIIILFLTGCGVWTDFTTFFNLYFNTNKLYEEIQNDISTLKTEAFQLKEPVISQNIKSKLNKLQEKSSKILQYNAESSYFDDALFMSGYAFYYNGDYVKAKRKFTELASFGNEDYDLKSKLWLGKSELQLRNFDEGMKILEEVKDSAIAREDDDNLRNVYEVIISFHIDREQYSTAISEAQNLIEISNDDELNALAAYQIGLLYLRDGNEEEAAKAFESVLEFSPDFETEFYSKFELAKLYKALGKVEESREMLNTLYNEGKYSQFWGEVYFQLGLIEYESENYERAFAIFNDVNKLYANSEGALESQLMLGEIMRNVYADYDSAKTYYDFVKSSNAPVEIKEKAELYSQSITNYLALKEDIKKSNRQITYILEPQEFVRDSLAHERYLAEVRDKNAAETGTQTPGNQTVGQTASTTDTTQTSPSDTSAVSDTTQNQSMADSLFAQTTTDFSTDDDYLLEVKPEFPKVGIDSLEAKIANDYFALGNLFFTDLIRPDSAYYYYDLLLNEFPETKQKPRVLYALGTYYNTKGLVEKSDSLFNVVYTEYKTHPIASEAAKKLGKPPLIRESDPAQAEFLTAESQIEEAQYDSAYVLLKNIVSNYPESIYKPKSLYTIGWLYENVTDEPDSAVKYYSKIIDEYKNSEYAMAVRRKVSNYQSELERIENEKKAGEEAEQTESSEEAINEDLQLEEQKPMPINQPITEPEKPDTTQIKEN